MQNIIVIGGGQHHNALGVVRAIGERGYGVELITIGNIKKHYISSSKYVSTHHCLRDLKELAAYLLFRERKVGTKKEIIISCADAVTEQLNIHYNRLSKRYILPGVDVEGKMVELMDKTIMMKMVAERGVSSPKVWSLPEEFNKVIFPCITKTYISSHGGKSDIVICKTCEQLNSFLDGNTDEVFVQDYIVKKEEVQFIGCAVYGSDDIIIPGMSKVLRSQPNTNTGFLEYGPIDPVYDKTVENAKQYIHDCNYHGLFSFEVIRDHDDKIWFLEINFRNDGNAWCTTKAGINLPVIWVKSCLGEDWHDEVHTPRQILMMPEFQDIKLVLQRKVSLFRWLKDWKRTDFFMEYDKRDPKPFWQYIFDKIR